MARGRGQGANQPGVRQNQTSMEYWQPALAEAVNIVGDIGEKWRQANEQGRKLRVKLGFDPTAPDIHLGHTVPLTKARAFQDLGAVVVLIVGDFTAQVGDPTGRNKTRPVLSDEQIKINAQTYADQASKILDPSRLEIRYNSEWLSKMGPMDWMQLLQTSTVAQMLERADFSKRYQEQEPISLLELVYPLLQGKDSVAINADVEIGGTDQLYNLGVGRQLNNQCLVTYPILPGIDGKERMSKSKGNYIGIDQDPVEMFGRFMRIPDEALPQYWRLVGRMDTAEQMAADLEAGRAHPMEAKRLLARHLISLYHDQAQAQHAEDIFNQRHVQRKLDLDHVPIRKLDQSGDIYLPALLKDHFDLKSRGDARRMIESGALRIDGEKITDLNIDSDKLQGRLVQLGRRMALQYQEQSDTINE